MPVQIRVPTTTKDSEKGLILFIRYLMRYKKINNKEILLINTCIKVKDTPIDEQYVLYTYTLNIKKSEIEDDVYKKYPELLNILPRACSLLVSLDETVIEPLFGPTKFTGHTPIDEDPDENSDKQPESTIFDYDKIKDWADKGELEITDTSKENGKFAIVRIISCHTSGKLIIICGSKNNHVAFLLEDIDQQIENTKDNIILLAILNAIKDNLDKLTNQDIIDLFALEYSLVGELCDGQHFCAAKDGIVYFGFFKNGNAMDTTKALEILRKVGIQTVDSKIVFSPDSDPSTLPNVFILPRCKGGEGSVLYFKNIKTGEIILVKSKSAKYIVWRMFRQVILKGYKNIENINERFINTSSYHNLSTEAAIRIVKQLMKFGLWMISKNLPCSILGHMPVESVRGSLPCGFYTWWNEYISEGNKDINVIPDDFGSFDADKFIAGAKIYKKRSHYNLAHVFFVQGLQGGGKSTEADEVCKRLEELGYNVKYIEQDQFYGDTVACQGAIYHFINVDEDPSKPTILIISRCNANPKQYDQYLNMLYKLPCVISFISHDVTKLYWMIALSGILKRSTNRDKLMVGGIEYPIEKVIEFTQENYENFKIHPLAWQVLTYTLDDKLTEEILKLKNPKDIQEFILSNFDELDGLRRPIDDIVKDMLKIILDTIHRDDVSHNVCNLKPIYVGCAIGPDDKTKLTEFVEKQNPLYEKFTKYVHHCTIDYLGGKKVVSYDQLKPGEKVICKIDALVIRKFDGACAFRVSNLTTEDGRQVKTTNKYPHITAMIPSELKPMCSNDFVGNTDDSVRIILCNYILETMIFYN